jgi:hypothetical protein
LLEEDEAMQLISKAISLDNRFKDLAKSDTDLNALRNNPEFKKC